VLSSAPARTYHAPTIYSTQALGHIANLFAASPIYSRTIISRSKLCSQFRSAASGN
jgi:hypothetical protein